MAKKPQRQKKLHQEHPKRITLGLVVDGLNDDQPILQGASTAAAEHDANLICTVGKKMKDQEFFHYQENILYELMDVTRLDGVITWAGVGAALGQYATEEEMDRFFKKFQPMPIVNYEVVVPGISSIRTDTALGMRDLLRHLIIDHGRKKILLLRGPEGHFETEERVRAYKETLTEFHIPINHQLMLPPFGFFETDYQQKIANYIEERHLIPGKDFDALAGTEPYLACWAIRALQARGVTIPQEVAAVGFNDEMINIATNPQVTAAKKPFFKTGYTAAELLLNHLEGKPLPEDTLIPAELVLRRSCGCISKTIIEASTSPVAAVEKTVQRQLPRLFKAGEKKSYPMPLGLAPKLSRASGPLYTKLPADWTLQLWSALETDLAKKTQNAFVETLIGMMGDCVEVEGWYTHWNSILTTLRESSRACFEGQDLDAAETLWQQGRICLAEAMQQDQIRKTATSGTQASTLTSIGLALAGAFDLETLTETIFREMPHLGIPSCYLCLYDDPRKPEETSRLILAYRDYQRIPLEQGGYPFPSRNFIPHEFLPENRRYSLVVEALYFREKPLGFIVFEIRPGDGKVYETLQGQIGSALNTALLFEQRGSLLRHLAENAREVDSVSRALADNAGVASQATGLVASTIDQQASAASQQADSINQIGNSVTEMDHTIQEVTDLAHNGTMAVAEAANVAQQGSSTVVASLESMNTIQERVAASSEKVHEMGRRSQEIGLIVQTLTDIAAQTNLLALNAAIEAAHAGETGRGFAVVAVEVRALSNQSKKEALRIRGLIDSMQRSMRDADASMNDSAKEVESGVRLANEAGEALKDILGAIRSVSQQVEAIAAAARTMSSRSSEISQAVENIASLSQENSDAVQAVSSSAQQVNSQVVEVLATAQALKEMADILNDIVAGA